MVINGKKLTIVFFLNKDVKSRKAKVENILLYPLYVRVSYNRRNTKFAIGNSWYAESVEEDLNDNEVLITIKGIIEKIVAYEAKNIGDRYEIKGLGKRLGTYFSNLLNAMYLSLNNTLNKEVGKTMAYIQFQEWNTLPLKQKVDEGVRFLKNKVSNNLSNHIILIYLLEEFAPQMFVYAWLMNDDRNIFLQRVKKKFAAARASGEKLVLGYIPVEGLDKDKGLQEFASVIDNVCKGLLNIGYTDKPDFRGVDIDLLAGKAKVRK